ncbi:succinate dehydrogenase, hydrophobic membrane anchor protein [Halovulum dunhuangense]|uniref:Succinate dehydrogenase hydrophobic membrane anchor subunit n=1 Tax=Halovulum dunhuangense TaxID=1505036 RepID=A0A849KTR7_9RHOB|nr:succinate dehydrogenase, hydrophobic membrane anchor protein [Halovulum dunhuangense]NNU78921.1 succinate dehydrogenase, hydrophobic membrane anchor protein [Halovulum dunhuangense]
MDYRTDRARVSGLGAAKEGVGHWWSQRMTSIALVPLTLLFVFPFAGALGGGFDEVRAVYQNPFNAIVAILFIGVTLYHHMQGLQVVIEDYIHGKAARTAALVANTLICWALGLSGVFAVAKIAFAG